MPEDFSGVEGSRMGEAGVSDKSEGEEVRFEQVTP